MKAKLELIKLSCDTCQSWQKLDFSPLRGEPTNHRISRTLWFVLCRRLCFACFFVSRLSLANPKQFQVTLRWSSGHKNDKINEYLIIVPKVPKMTNIKGFGSGFKWPHSYKNVCRGGGFWSNSEIWIIIKCFLTFFEPKVLEKNGLSSWKSREKIEKKQWSAIGDQYLRTFCFWWEKLQLEVPI